MRNNLSIEFIEQTSRNICERVIQLDVYRHAKRIALYQSYKGEVKLDRLWQIAPYHGKHCYFPVSGKDKISFVRATPNSKFQIGRFGVPEPVDKDNETISVQELDLILMPLVAFDSFGMRIGMGKGFYDRTLSELQVSIQDKPILLGVAYDFQHHPVLLKQPWDILLHGTLTEKKVYWVNQPPI